MPGQSVANGPVAQPPLNQAPILNANPMGVGVPPLPNQQPNLQQYPGPAGVIPGAPGAQQPPQFAGNQQQQQQHYGGKMPPMPPMPQYPQVESILNTLYI